VNTLLNATAMNQAERYEKYVLLVVLVVKSVRTSILNPGVALTNS
jgi:hypothetical protein